MTKGTTLSATLLALGAGAAGVAALSGAPTAGGASELVVDAASRGGPCSDGTPPAEVARSAPWCSLERAVQAAPEGSTVTVRAADYPRLVVRGDRSRTRPLTFEAADGEAVTIAGATISDSSHLAFRGVTFSETFDAAAAADHLVLSRVSITAGGVNLRAGVHDVLVERSTIASPEGAAVNFSSTPATPEIANVTLRGNRIVRAVADGLQLKRFRNVVIEGNEITGVARVDPREHSDVLQTVFGGHGLVFRGNHVHGNAAGILLKDGATSGVVIENNLIVRNAGDGAGYAIQVWESAAPRIVGNTVWDNAYGVVLRTGTAGAEVRNNILQSLQVLDDATLAYEDFNLIARGLAGGRHDTRRPPRFTSSASGSYRLAARSPGIDAATSRAARGRDRLGRRRVDDPRVRNRGQGRVRFYDMGANERQVRR